jgi:hypothetical protein
MRLDQANTSRVGAGGQGMTPPLGIKTSLVALATAAVAAGLDVLAVPPDWLLAVEDSDRMLENLEANRGRLGIGPVALVSCKFKRAQLAGGTWSTLHRLKVREPDVTDVRQVDLRGHLVPPGHDAPAIPASRAGSEAWQGYLPDLRLQVEPEPADVALAALPELTRPERAAPILEAALRSRGGAFSEIRLGSCRPEVMRYREGRRCTIRYELDYASGPRNESWPEAVIAKIYEGDEARHTYTAMTALWESPLGRTTTVTIAEPLALVPGHNLMLQRVVPGDRTLKSAINESFAEGAAAGAAAMRDVMRRTGRGLAELHTCGVTYGPQVPWASQMTAVRDAADQLVAAMPHLEEAVRPLLTGLDSVAGDGSGVPLVPTHRSFRAAQVMLDGRNLSFLDFDGFCQAEPGLDLALFRATLCELALRAITPDDTVPPTVGELEDSMLHLDDLCATFLEGYEEVAPLNRERLAVWDAATGVKDVLDCWRKVKFEYLDRRIWTMRRLLGLGAGEPTSTLPG